LAPLKFSPWAERLTPPAPGGYKNNMSTYQEIKKKNSDAINAIMEQQKVFWAFSNEQLEKGKAQIGITENSQLTSIGMGGFCPKVNADELFNLLALENKRYKTELKDAKEEKEQAIKYELSNHECWYTGNLEPVIDLFDGLYTAKEIKEIYLKYKK